MPALEVYCRDGCTLAHWRRGERLRWFFSSVRCNGKPNPHPGILSRAVGPGTRLCDLTVEDFQKVMVAFSTPRPLPDERKTDG